MPRLTVDGIEVDCPAGTSIRAAASSAGVDIPALCDDPRLSPAGACRVCVVDVEGAQRPLAACTTPITEAMVVRTMTPEIRELRNSLLDMLVRRYPAATQVSRPDLPFHRLLAEYGVVATGTADPSLVDASHPAIHVDLNSCISCWRCVRMCDEVQGQFTWRIDGRGARSHVVPDSGTTLATSSCVSCGACVDTCPTDALSDAGVVDDRTPVSWTRTTCPYCGVGCEMMVGSRNGQITQVRPAHDAPVNRGHLCVKGRYGFGFNASNDRITTPMLRGESGQWEPVGWAQAIDAAVTGFRRILDAAGPTAVGMLGSARVTNEENYLTQKFARLVLGTNNVDCCARVCHAPSAAGLKAVFGTGAATNSFEDIEIARTIVVCGTNSTEAHPIVGARIKQAALRGANLVVIDPRRIELAEYADVHLRPHPGTNVAALNSLAAAIVDEGLFDAEFLSLRVEQFNEFRDFVKDYLPEHVSLITGLEAQDVRRAARLYAGQRPSMLFHGLGVTEHVQGTHAVMCLANLALLTGNIGKPGTGCNPLRGQNNVQGSAHMGCEPHHLTGMIPLASGRERAARVWGAPVPDIRGLDAMEMFDAAAEGRLRAMWVVGWDVALTQPQTPEVERALAALDVLVVQDLFLTETARRYATVFLPAASSFEKDGTFMNSERRIQRVRAAVPMPSGVRTDASILCLAASAFGRSQQFSYQQPAGVWDEVRRMWPAGAGITYPRLDNPGGLQWPCPDEDHAGSTLLHQHEFPGLGVRAALRRVDHHSTDELPSEQYPFVLITGRELYSFNAATMTGRSATAALSKGPLLEISPSDAAGLSVDDGDSVCVRSHHGEIVLPCRITEHMRSGAVFTTFSDPSVAVNTVIGPGRDSITHTPEYKVTAVAVERVAGGPCQNALQQDTIHTQQLPENSHRARRTM
ncbi:formate dehydrogenase subunit alpha [Mycolicibacterium wolinskyi]|uniref:formate dehydrogenase subunit alpha n=1 Tax=Mycolicibacterium wolinskyi TaxID=59750 RepID=UPI000A056706|nr:formate dehydrogenase subunit alpha [Mycolicibacterium wolinskyi]